MQTPSSDTAVPWLSEHAETAWRSFLTLARAVERAMDRQLQRDSNLSGSEYEVLVPLSEAPDGALASRELLRFLGWERSRLSHLLSRMEKRGMICRKPAPRDGRGLVVELTDSGRRMIVSAAPAHLAMVREAFIDHVSPEQMQAFVAVREQVLPRLEDMDLT